MAAAARVYAEEIEVGSKLWSLFGITRDQCVAVVKEVVGARADAVEDDPLAAAGLFAYIHGTRNVRGLLRPLGWRNYRKDNIELVRHPDLDLMVAYQSVDLAASTTHTPRAISGKGAGAERAIDEAQLLLPIDPPVPAGSWSREIRSGMWFFCISINGEDIRAELSLPSGVEGGNFGPFIERIFILKEGDWAKAFLSQDVENDAAEFEPKISRK